MVGDRKVNRQKEDNIKAQGTLRATKATLKPRSSDWSQGKLVTSKKTMEEQAMGKKAGREREGKEVRKEDFGL